MVKNRIKARNLLCAALIGMLLIGVCLILSSFRPAKMLETTRLVGGLAFVSMIVNTLLVYLSNGKFNFAVVFAMLSYLFSFGQAMLYALGYKLSPTNAFSIINGFFSNENMYSSSMFSLCAIALTCLGMCMVADKNQRLVWKKRPTFVSESNARVLGWILLALSILPMFYILYLDIKTTFTVSYGATIQDYTGFAKICSLLSGFFTSAILLLLCFETSKPKRWIMWGVIAVYAMMQLAGGSRMSIIRLGVTILLLWGYYFKTINRRRAVRLIIWGLIALFALSLLSATRIYFAGTRDIVKLIRGAMGSMLEDNFLFKTINEMGNSQLVNLSVFRFCPTEVPFQHGQSYLKMLSAIIPSVGGNNTNYIGVDIIFSELYPKTAAPLGATYMAEAYWNFGWYSLPLLLLFGYLMGKISAGFFELCNSNREKATRMFLSVYLINYFVFMPRGELLGFGRSIVWYAFIPILLSKIWYGSKK